MLELQHITLEETVLDLSLRRWGRRVVGCAVLGAAVAALVGIVPPAHAQSVDATVDTSFAAAVRRARAVLAADRGRLWGARLDTLRWMGVDDKRVWLSANPRVSGYVRDGTLWTGPLPAGITPSNTSVTWNGARWAMVILPFPVDSATATRLLIHEAMHVDQPSLLPQPKYDETANGSGLLDEAAGRTQLREEWRALTAALRAPSGIEGIGGRARRDAIRDALAFRAARYAGATPDEITRERAIDVTEGLPEYTSWRLTHTTDRAFAAQIDSAPQRLPSFVRGFMYYTGPAYAMLLDDYEGSAWRREVRALPDLQRLLFVAWHDRAPRDPDATLIGDALAGRMVDGRVLDPGQRARLATLERDAAARYDGAAIRAEEDARWAAREKQLAEYRATFVTGPTLRIRPKSLNISFDPRGQASLGDAGTVMANLAWRGPDGAELHAPAGALVTPKWDEVRVPLGDVHLAPGPLAAPVALSGAGWTLVLPAGWVVTPEGSSMVFTPGTH